MVDAIILAGGKGSRMEDSLPKALVEAKGRTILSYQMDYLLKFREVRKIILALGHKAGEVIRYVEQNYPGCDIEFSVEDYPLGTAGAVKKAMSKSLAQFVVVLNCDDIADIPIPKLAASTENVLCVANPRLPFGNVKLGSDGYIDAFVEKPLLDDCWVSCGWYLFDRYVLLDVLPNRGSLEYDVFPKIKLGYYKHGGFWRALNSRKDIGEFEKLELPEVLL